MSGPIEAYVALLRGINVGGKNLIRMEDLRTCFEEHGFAGARTYIASGNVLFETTATDPRRLTKRIEAALSKEMGQM